MAGHGDGCFHVNSVDVWAFLAVHLDVHEMLVEETCHFNIFKRLMCHDVTPMASRIPDTQEDWNVFCASLFKSFRTPFPPVNGIFGMLQ